MNQDLLPATYDFDPELVPGLAVMPTADFADVAAARAMALTAQWSSLRSASPNRLHPLIALSRDLGEFDQRRRDASRDLARWSRDVYTHCWSLGMVSRRRSSLDGEKCDSMTALAASASRLRKWLINRSCSAFRLA